MKDLTLTDRKSENANAYPSRLIVEVWTVGTRIVRTFERLECKHVMQRPINKNSKEMLSKSGRRCCRECYLQGIS